MKKLIDINEKHKYHDKMEVLNINRNDVSYQFLTRHNTKFNVCCITFVLYEDFLSMLFTF